MGQSSRANASIRSSRMPYHLRMDGDLLRCDFHGTFTSADLARMGEEINALERAQAVVPDRLTDLSGASVAELDYGAISALANRRRQSVIKNKVRSAVVGATPLHYGLARMYQMLNDHPMIELRVFSSQAEALEWIRQPRNP